MSIHITVTLGPATRAERITRRLIQTTDRLRLNTAFLKPSEIIEQLNNLEKIFNEENMALPVVLDLQGAKMRIGQMDNLNSLPDKVNLIYNTSTDKRDNIPVPHQQLFSSCHHGDILSLNDCRIKLRVIKTEVDKIIAGVLKNGPLSSYKGINREIHPIPFDELTSRDKNIIQSANCFSFVEYAYSFVFEGNEADLLHGYTNQALIAKIERPETFKYLDKICGSFDEIWFCRGDLGAQAGILNLPKLQNQFIQLTKEYTGKKIIAGQILEHMTHFPEPTRSEVVHLYNALKDGFDGIVLSDETAIGQYPDNIADLMNKIKAAWSISGSR
jgi:pyruvate kinase